MTVWVVIEYYYCTEALYTYVYKKEKQAHHKYIKLAKRIGDNGLFNDVGLAISKTKLGK